MMLLQAIRFTAILILMGFIVAILSGMWSYVSKVLDDNYDMRYPILDVVIEHIGYLAGLLAALGFAMLAVLTIGLFIQIIVGA